MNLRALAFLAATAAVSADTRYFRYERSILDTPSKQLQTCVVLDAAAFTHASPLVSDLRLYHDGRETPYAIHFASSAAAASKNVAPLNLGEQRGHVVFDVAMPEGPYNDIDLDLGAHDFIATFDVFGSQSQTGESTKIGSYTIFDFTSQKLGRSTVLHLPESDFRYLHFRSDGPLKPEDVTGLNIARTTESKPQYVTLAETSQITQKNRKTVIEFALTANVPVDRAEFAVDPQPSNFNRDVTVTVTPQKNKQPAEGRDMGPSTSSGSILRIHGVHNGHRIDEERLSIDPPIYTDNVATKWVVEIDNGDDAPLALKSVRLQMLERMLCFDAMPGTSYTLYYGDSALSTPRYDYATLFAPEQDAARATLGPEQSNPEYQPRPDERPFTEKHPALLWTVLVLVILMLGGIALRSAKQVPQK
ncbi:MAG TPA: DUF3999 family protein [Silvibacterium sp.]|nr:DUF3999 family protein [Silvibacterium sp.]